MKLLFAGFGGQGILFAGKFVAYCGMLAGYQVSWLPSYGPEMRGGTANCGVVLSDKSIGSPLVVDPDVLITMNLPSLDKFEASAVPGARVFVDSSLINRELERGDVAAFYIPATGLADKNGLKGLANMIMVGKLLKEISMFTPENIRDAMGKTVSARKKDLFDANLKAIEIGDKY